MKSWKTMGKKLLLPPVWVTALLVLLSAGALVTVFLKGWETTPVACGIYVLSFYTLTVVCSFCVKILPGWYRWVRQRLDRDPYMRRYMTDAVFQTHVSLYRSLAINLLYVGVNVVSCLLYRSAWFAILAVYYTILAGMRFLLLRYVNRNKVGAQRISELKRSRTCAAILMTVNLTLSGAVLMILYQNKGYDYHGILIYVMALYTFYITTHAIIDIVKYRKYNSPVLSTAKVISLCAALVSMLSLESAMLSQFGADMAPGIRWLFIAATGGGVSVVVVTMSVYMILRANREIKQLQTPSKE